VPNAIGGVFEAVLHDQSLLAIGTKLKALDIQIVQYPSISKPIAIRVIDQLGALRKYASLVSFCVCHLRPKTVDELDRGQPQAAHFTWHVLTHVREIPILRSDQVRPVARGHIGLRFVSPLITNARQRGCYMIIRGR